MEPSSPMSRRSSILFGIHSENKDLEDMLRVKRQNQRFTIIAAAIIFLLILSLMSVIIVEIYNTTIVASTKNITIPKLEHLGELVKAQEWKTLEDVEIEPQEQNLAEERWDDVHNTESSLYENEGVVESFGGDRSKNQHANHRYDQQVEVQPLERIGWKPRPFTLPHGFDPKNQTVNSIQDVIGRPSLYRPAPVPLSYPPHSMFRPMRFKGFYIHPQSQDPVNDESRDENYYEKINNFFQRPKPSTPTTVSADAAETTVKNDTDRPTYYDNGIENSNLEPVTQNPALHTQAIYHPFHESKEKDVKSKSWNRINNKPKKKPFTVMLDIYPMNKESGEDEEEGESAPKLVFSAKKPKDTIFLPFRSNPQFIQPVPQATRLIPHLVMPPKLNPGRMLMKLNLFPKTQNRRTFSMFGNGKQGWTNYDDYYDDVGGEEEHQCNGVIGHNPYGKPITAKWKTKQGDWVNAKFVTLNKYAGGRMDPR